MALFAMMVVGTSTLAYVASRDTSAAIASNAVLGADARTGDGDLELGGRVVRVGGRARGAGRALLQVDEPNAHCAAVKGVVAHQPAVLVGAAPLGLARAQELLGEVHARGRERA
ncbi:MAG: hypothetical protein ACKOEP_09010, partial [Phycisphaerales bacterium]